MKFDTFHATNGKIKNLQPFFIDPKLILNLAQNERTTESNNISNKT
jgi:hypothetical protein